MEADITKLSSKELEEKIRELEHTYVDFFGDAGNLGELHHIRKKILEMQKELSKRRDL